ncbi:MAG TPA: hypothetical protein ENO25_03695 [Desulfobacteraceae bacterium]|nr:hypothetical protein [Desulfobacteraceae bacterium]
MVAKKEVLHSNPEKCGFSHRPSDRLSFVYIFYPSAALSFRSIQNQISIAAAVLLRFTVLEGNDFFRELPLSMDKRRPIYTTVELKGVNMKKEYIKPFVWGIAVGMGVLLIVIFSAGWVVTTGSAEAEAKEMATDAVMDRLAPIGIAQFMQDPNKEQRLEEMKGLESWGANNRSDYVEKQGWATMPGEEGPDSQVADEVARRLMNLKM